MGIPSFHDDTQGSQRGKNIIFAFELDGIRLCHLGDLGHMLNQAQLDSIGKVDILFIPVGGAFTIDGDQANSVVAKLKPRLVIPMHFKTPLCSIPLDGVYKFLAGKERVRRVKSLEITSEELPAKTEIALLDI
jgi:L-ascorbate metabolism protein UlaG (beta-lactamase superfamily)